MDMLTNARDLVAREFSVIPLDHPDETHETDPKRIGKVPLVEWKRFQKERPIDADLQEWFGNGHKRNTGIPTGEVSHVIVIDGDSAAGLAWMHAHLPVPPMRTKTAKGEHWYYRHPGVRVRNKARIRTGDPAVKIDIRGDGGYVVGPGSKHQTGIIYEPLGEWPPTSELPVFEPAWVEPAADTRRSPHGRTDQHTRLQRARAYVDQMPPAIEGEGGDTHTFTICCALTRGFDLTDDEAFELLQDWNTRCVPTWSDDDLKAKIANARAHGTEPIGGRLADFPCTEAGDAEHFAVLYAGRVCFDARRSRWLLIEDNSGLWLPDPVERLRGYAVEPSPRPRVHPDPGSGLLSSLGLLWMPACWLRSASPTRCQTNGARCVRRWSDQSAKGSVSAAGRFFV